MLQTRHDKLLQVVQQFLYFKNYFTQINVKRGVEKDSKDKLKGQSLNLVGLLFIKSNNILELKEN